MVSLSVLGNERERTSGTSEDALSRMCARSRTAIGSRSVLQTAADSRDVFRAVREYERRERPRRRVRAGDRPPTGKATSRRRCASGWRRLIGEGASARPALSPRSPWMRSARGDATSVDACIPRSASISWLPQIVPLGAGRRALVCSRAPWRVGMTRDFGELAGRKTEGVGFRRITDTPGRRCSGR
jgi:hypothetical protein